jgi:integrase/recombinase XerD
MAVPDPIPEFQFLDEIEPALLTSSLESATPADLRWIQVEEFFRNRELAPNTRKAYEREIRQFMSWIDQPWNNITSRDVYRYQQRLQTQRSPQGKALTPATINRSLSALQSFFKWLTAQGYISQNPSLTLKKPKAQEKELKELKDAELKALFAALALRGENEARDTALLRVLQQGLKLSQVSALNVQDYDGVQLQSKDTSSSEIRRVLLAQEARGAIDAYLDWRSRRKLSTAPESPLFLSGSNNSRGERLGYWGIYKMITELAESANVKGCDPNRLRRTFVSMQMKKREDLASSVVDAAAKL